MTEKILELIKKGYEVDFIPDFIYGVPTHTIRIRLRHDKYCTETIVDVTDSCRTPPEEIIEWALDRAHQELRRYMKKEESNND